MAALEASTTSVPPEQLADAELVANFRAGAELALGELIRRHQIAIFRLLLGMLGSGDDAERACESVFLDAARRIDELVDASQFFSFAAGIAREAAMKLELERKKTAPVAAPRPVPRDPRGLVKQQVRDILGELSGDERLALILADLENDSYESIATTLGTTPLEAASIVEQARTKFRTALDQRDERVEPSAGATETFEQGTVIAGRYRIEAQLGRGGMGAVYRATDLETEDVVALKVLLSESKAEPALRRRFEREAEIIRRVAHPHFVRYVGAGQAAGEPEFVVMEYLDGQALSHLLRVERRLAPERALRLLRQMLVALEHAHGLGVVHRDVKPDNVMLVPREGEREFVKILDLGIARLTGPDDASRTQLTQRGEVFGTPAYMAPEQVRGEPVDGRADLYALTAMLFEMLAARPPFQSNTSMGLLAMHLATPPPRLADLAPGIRSRAPLQALLDRGLAKDPEERFPSAQTYLASVESTLAAGVDADVVPAPDTLDTPDGPARPARLAHAPTIDVRTGEVPAAAKLRWIRRLSARPGRIAALAAALAIICLALWVAWGYVGSGRLR
ncbi:MAG TPA: protein kinase [Polyangiaceae bacterium]|nr:protein kinase [Polyangiaceae bacterium]